MGHDRLRHGDVVELRSAAEILATLDDRGTMDGLPFMPEMLQYFGRRFVVDRRADKICDTIATYTSLRMPDTVLLEDLRCDGAGHDGCQAECRLLWKEAWLRRVDRDASPSADVDDGARDALARVVTANARIDPVANGQSTPTYRCQATELVRASEYLRTSDPRPYLREYSSGNVSLGRWLRITTRAALRELLRKLRVWPVEPLRGPAKQSTPRTNLTLQPGDLVRVKSKEEIAQTLNQDGKNRGLWFDPDEMLPFCGRTYRVRQRVKHFIDERNGQMIELKTDSVTLDGVVCSGERSVSRWFCPRAIFPYWREAWLERVDAGPTDRLPDRPRSINLPVAPASATVVLGRR